MIQLNDPIWNQSSQERHAARGRSSGPEKNLARTRNKTEGSDSSALADSASSLYTTSFPIHSALVPRPSTRRAETRLADAGLQD